jgi:hypothetical protein
MCYKSFLENDENSSIYSNDNIRRENHEKRTFSMMYPPFHLIKYIARILMTNMNLLDHVMRLFLTLLITSILASGLKSVPYLVQEHAWAKNRDQEVEH